METDLKPIDEWDIKDAENMGAPAWMLEATRVNPDYCGWDPGDDYMSGKGWSENITIETWADFGWTPDEMNVIADFHFRIARDTEDCPTCAGRGLHPDALWISESFYGHSTPFRRRTWQEEQAGQIMARFGAPPPDAPVQGYPSEETLAKYGPAFRAFCEEMRAGDGAWGKGPFTEDERQALIDHHRDPDGGIMGHDAINRGILIEARVKRLGLPYHCPACEGSGSRFTEPAPRLALILWALHPRKGASRGVTIRRVEQGELPAALAFLREAARQNAARFARVGLLETTTRPAEATTTYTCGNYCGWASRMTSAPDRCPQCGSHAIFIESTPAQETP